MPSLTLTVCNRCGFGRRARVARRRGHGAKVGVAEEYRVGGTLHHPGLRTQKAARSMVPIFARI